MAKNQHLVLAFFDSEALADQAAAYLKDWDKATEEIKLGNIGILVKDDKGKIKTHKLGPRKTVLWAVIGALVGVLSGGVTILGGAVVGGILGSFVRKGLGLSKDDLARIGAELDGDKAAVAVLVDAAETQNVSDELSALGGKPEAHAVSADTVEHAEAAAAEAPEEEPAAEAAPGEEAAPEQPAA